MTGAFSDLLPLDVRANAARTRALILSANHEAHKAELAAIDARYDAFSSQINALCDEWEEHRSKYMARSKGDV